LHAEKEIKKQQNRGGRRVTWRGVAVASCVSGGAVAEAGGGDLFTDSDSRQRCGCFRRFGSFSPFLPFSLFSRFLLFSGWSFLFSRYSSLFFFVLLSSFSLLRSISSPLSPLFFLFSPCSSPLFSPSPLLLLCCLLFIEPSEWLFAVEHGEQPAGWPLGATAKARPPLLGFLAGARWVVGHCVRSVGSRQEWPAKIQKKDFPFSFFPAACSGGRRKMNSVVQNDIVLLFLFFFFFFFECMKLRRFGENAPFHLNVAPKRAKFQISPQSSFFLQLHPCQFRSPPLLLAVFFTLVLGL
jgi:hypothetical protein